MLLSLPTDRMWYDVQKEMEKKGCASERCSPASGCQRGWQVVSERVQTNGLEDQRRTCQTCTLQCVAGSYKSKPSVSSRTKTNMLLHWRMQKRLLSGRNPCCHFCMKSTRLQRSWGANRTPERGAPLQKAPPPPIYSYFQETLVAKWGFGFTSIQVGSSYTRAITGQPQLRSGRHLLFSGVSFLLYVDTTRNIYR